MGACFVKGLNRLGSRDRHRRVLGRPRTASRRRGRLARGAGRLRGRRAAATRIASSSCSRGPYSGVPGSEVRVTETEWLERSLIVRAEHESTHDLTWRLFGVVRSHATDDIIADFVGLVRAFGVYPTASRASCSASIGCRVQARRPPGQLSRHAAPRRRRLRRGLLAAVPAPRAQLAAVATRHGNRPRRRHVPRRLVHALSLAQPPRLADDGLADAVDATAGADDDLPSAAPDAAVVAARAGSQPPRGKPRRSCRC